MSNNNTGKAYTVARLNKDNLKDIEQLHEAVYGTPRPAHYFSRKYDTAYTGVAYIGYIAYSPEQLPIAYYGVIPCFLQYGDNIVLSAQSADTMTHPGYRYKGMFVELSHLTFALCREAGIHIVFGFPNQNSYHGAIHRMNWRETETMDCFIIPVRTLPLAFIAKRGKLLGKLYAKYSSALMKKYLSAQAGVANSVIADGFAGVQRGSHYLQYKKYSSTRVIQTGKAKLWINTRNGLIIGDMEEVDESNFESVISIVQKIACRLGIRKIFFRTSPHTSLHRLFSQKYKAIPSFPVLFQDFGTTIPLEKIKFTFSDIDIF